MRSRPVQARAMRIAIIDASVPELWKRIRSTDGISAWTARAQAISCSVLAPSWVPCGSWAVAAATTSGWLCPSSSAPWPIT